MIRTRSTVQAALLLAFATVGTGCMSIKPDVPHRPLHWREMIRVRFDSPRDLPAQHARTKALIELRGVREFEGRFIRPRGDTLLVEVLHVTDATSRIPRAAVGTRVLILRGPDVAIDVRRVACAQTAAMLSLSTAIFVIVLAFVSIGNASA